MSSEIELEAISPSLKFNRPVGPTPRECGRVRVIDELGIAEVATSVGQSTTKACPCRVGVQDSPGP